MKGRLMGELRGVWMGGLRSWYDGSWPYSVLQLPLLSGDKQLTEMKQFANTNVTFIISKTEPTKKQQQQQPNKRLYYSMKAHELHLTEVIRCDTFAELYTVWYSDVDMIVPIHFSVKAGQCCIANTVNAAVRAHYLSLPHSFSTSTVHQDHCVVEVAEGAVFKDVRLGLN